MAAKNFGGKYSPGSSSSSGKSAHTAPAFANRRARKVSLRARMMLLLPLPLLFAAFGSIGRGSPVEMLAEVGGFSGLMLSAWLLNEGLRAEEVYAARKVARPPAIPRKLFAAVLTGLSVALVSWVSWPQPLFGALVFGGVAVVAHIVAFGLDPMRRKGMEGVDAFATERVAVAIDKAEDLLRDITGSSARIGDRKIESRVERLCDQAREVFRAVEEDPRDLNRARRFLSVYLLGLKDATAKFADIYGRSRDQDAYDKYAALLTDMETSFKTHRTDLLEDDRSDLDVEIEVLRERLQQDGLTTK